MWLLRCLAANGDDASAAFFPHMWDDGTRDVEGGREVLSLHLRPGLRVSFVDGCAARESADHVHQYINVSEAIDHLIDQRLDAVSVGEVDSSIEEVGVRKVGLTDAERCADDHLAGVQELLGDEVAETTLGTGDQ